LSTVSYQSVCLANTKQLSGLRNEWIVTYNLFPLSRYIILAEILASSQEYSRTGIGYDTKHRGFQYSQQDIFRDILSNQAIVDELSRMFAQAGLRFDQDFLNRVFFEGSGSVFQSFTSPGRTTYHQYFLYIGVPARKSNLIERLLSRMTVKISKYILRKLFGVEFEPLPKQNLNLNIELEISWAEAATGCEKGTTYKKGKQKRSY